MNNYPPLIVICGPTGSGKSEVAIALALRIDGEIISADSRQIYKTLNKGTAKPSKDDMSLVAHHLVDIIDLLEDFTLNDFQDMAFDAIMDVYKRGKRPVLTGGSGLYIKAVTDGLLLPLTPPDKEWRRKLRDLAVKNGTVFLYEKLKEVDKESAGRIHPNDLRRIVRALEVFYTAKEPITSLQNKRKKNPFSCIKIGINWKRELLYERIDRRVDKMFEMGLTEEVEGILKKGFTFGFPPLDALGYPETADYLLGRSTMEETLRLIKRNTRHFARRQLTWFRKDKELFWIDPGECLHMGKMLGEIGIILEENKGL